MCSRASRTAAGARDDSERERPARALPLAAAFALVIAVGVGVATLTVSTLSSIRAYLVGEGLYSKAEREAAVRRTSARA